MLLFKDTIMSSHIDSNNILKLYWNCCYICLSIHHWYIVIFCAT